MSGDINGRSDDEISLTVKITELYIGQYFVPIIYFGVFSVTKHDNKYLRHMTMRSFINIGPLLPSPHHIHFSLIKIKNLLLDSHD